MRGAAPEREEAYLRQLKVILAMAGALASAACSNNSSNVCCIEVNGSKSYWNCPTTAAESACCGSGTNTPGCITDPMDPAASGCTNNASPSDCP
jgi:hypothetical protein